MPTHKLSLLLPALPSSRYKMQRVPVVDSGDLGSSAIIECLILAKSLTFMNLNILISKMQQILNEIMGMDEIWGLYSLG